jgi:hypothetical protein
MGKREGRNSKDDLPEQIPWQRWLAFRMEPRKVICETPEAGELSMPFDDRYTIPRERHALTCVDSAGVVHWCIRCGVLWLDLNAAGGRPQRCVWQSADQRGRTRETPEAPPCRRSTAAGEDSPVADQRLMLRALTSGWKCERILLASAEEGWLWSRPAPFQRESYAVPGRWLDGPVLDASTRRMLLTASG